MCSFCHNRMFVTCVRSIFLLQTRFLRVCSKPYYIRVMVDMPRRICDVSKHTFVMCFSYTVMIREGLPVQLIDNNNRSHILYVGERGVGTCGRVEALFSARFGSRGRTVRCAENWTSDHFIEVNLPTTYIDLSLSSTISTEFLPARLEGVLFIQYLLCHHIWFS